MQNRRLAAEGLTSTDERDQQLGYTTTKDDTIISTSFPGLLEICHQDATANCTFVCHSQLLHFRSQPSELSYAADYLCSKTLGYPLVTGFVKYNWEPVNFQILGSLTS